MIIKDIRKEFFDQLKGRILILCALDVDAICACKILQSLLESYNLQYGVAPVATVDNLLSSFEEYRDSVDAIVLINFGNVFNIPKLLNNENLIFYVIDSHRPIDVHNFYKNPQVKLYINRDESELNIPPRSKIFLNGVEEEDINLLNADPRDLTNEQLENRRNLREWMVEKHRLMFNYEEFNYYDRSVSLIMYDLAHYLSKCNNYLLWLGIVGLTYQLKSDKIKQSTFEVEANRLVRHISRNQVSSHHSKGNNWKIEWKRDLQLDLYRKWTIYDSLSHTPLSVCKFQLWNEKGQRNLSEFLVECGLKVVECKQCFVSMSLDYRGELLESVQRVCLGEAQYKYNLQDLITRAFTLNCGGFKLQYCANDIVLALRALLDSSELAATERFVHTIQSLSHHDGFKSLNTGFEAAQTQMKSVFEQVKTLITTSKVLDLGPFLHVDLQEQFARGDSLMTFTRFLLEAYVSSKSTRLARRAVRLPMILFCPDRETPEHVLVLGIPPIAQEAKKNFFGKAFKQAAENIGCDLKSDLSETNLVKVDVNHKNQLLEEIKLLME